MKHLLAPVLSLSLLMAATAAAAPPAAPLTAPAASGQRQAQAPTGQVHAPAAAQAQRPALGERRALHGQTGPQHHRHGPGHAQEHRRYHGRGGAAMAGPRAGGPAGMRHGRERIRLGAPLAENRQGVVVSEPGRHGLRKAPRGQEWRKLGQRYVRVTSGSNVVNEIVINGL